MRFSTALRSTAGAVVATVPTLVRDLIGLAGAASIVFGVWQIHQSSAWIVAGVMMVAVALRLARPARGEGE